MMMSGGRRTSQGEREWAAANCLVSENTRTRCLRSTRSAAVISSTLRSSSALVARSDREASMRGGQWGGQVRAEYDDLRRTHGTIGDGSQAWNSEGGGVKNSSFCLGLSRGLVGFI